MTKPVAEPAAASVAGSSAAAAAPQMLEQHIRKERIWALLYDASKVIEDVTQLALSKAERLSHETLQRWNTTCKESLSTLRIGLMCRPT